MSQVKTMRPIAGKTAVMSAKEESRYMRTFRGTECEACGIDDGTVVGAHLNIDIGGMGWRVRGAVAGLCASCHDLADGRTKAPMVERMKVWVRVCQTRLVKDAREFQRRGNG